jgi:hypothetical protein
MTQPHVIELALDLARMPALARSSAVPPLPPNIVELMRIAAASPEACRAAVAQTCEPRHVVVEAARFYLQQVLFRPDADCYRILGVQVYAERVLKAWREVSNGSAAKPNLAVARASSDQNKKRRNRAIRLTWIERPVQGRVLAIRNPYHAFVLIPIGLVIIVLALWSANGLLQP